MSATSHRAAGAQRLVSAGSEARRRQREGRGNLVKAGVAVNAVQTAAVHKPVEEGLAIAAETYKAGTSALEEKRFRRLGLGVSLIAIVLTMLGLWLAIRTIEGTARQMGLTIEG